MSSADTAHKAALQAVVDFAPDFGSVPLSLTEAVTAAESALTSAEAALLKAT